MLMWCATPPPPAQFQEIEKRDLCPFRPFVSAAAHLFRRLQADELEEELDVDLTQDHALLNFFGELLRSMLVGSSMFWFRKKDR